MIFLIVSLTMEAIGGLSVKDDKKITEISFLRTIRMALFCPATEKCPKERANGGTHGSPLDPPSFRRPRSGRTGLKG